MPMHIGSKFTGYTALSSTTGVALGGADLELPDGAKSILAVIPYLADAVDNTTAEGSYGKIEITSSDVKINPCEILSQPVGSCLIGAAIETRSQAPASHVIYPVNVPVNGGEDLTITGYGLINHTVEPYMGCEVIYSDVPPHKAQRFYKLGTLTAIGTAAALVAGSGISVTNGKHLIEINGFAVSVTPTTKVGVAGYLYVTSEGFTPAWQLYLPIEPSPSGEGTDLTEACAGVARRKVMLDLDAKCTINDNYYSSVALTGNGKWICGVGYTSRSDRKPI